MRKYPIGIHSFAEIRRLGCAYVDKTEYIHKLVASGKYFLLCRPSGFGKSVLLSTLKEYFEGNRELFRGLELEKHKDSSSVSHPVVFIDFGGGMYSDADAVASRLGSQLEALESLYEIDGNEENLASRLRKIIGAARRTSGERVVVLVDDYDKPIRDTVGQRETFAAIGKTLNDFYSVLNSADEDIEFCMVAGVTQMGQSCIGSFGNLRDISVSTEFAGICGFSEEELSVSFSNDIGLIARDENLTKERTLLYLTRIFGGYRFSSESEQLFNPSAILTALSFRSLHPHKYNVDAPDCLIEIFRRKCYDIDAFDNIDVRGETLVEAPVADEQVISLLFQTGFLTIKDFDRDFHLYLIGYANSLVREALRTMIGHQCPESRERTTPTDVVKMTNDLRGGNIEGFLQRMQVLFANFPYENVLDIEQHFQNVIYIAANMLGLHSQIERHTSNGRIDLVIKTKDYVYIIEFKRDKSPDVALRQIEEKEYAAPFIGGRRSIIKVGVNFSTKKRSIDGWKIVRPDNTDLSNERI